MHCIYYFRVQSTEVQSVIIIIWIVHNVLIGKFVKRIILWKFILFHANEQYFKLNINLKQTVTNIMGIINYK
jgi:hypothetical protein